MGRAIQPLPRRTSSSTDSSERRSAPIETSSPERPRSTLSLPSPRPSSAQREGAEASAQLEELLAGYTNYLLDPDPRNWRTHVPNYRRVRYRNVYPGIDVVYYGNPRELEFDFVVAPGADPRRIRLTLDNPDLRIRLPRVYQNHGDILARVVRHGGWQSSLRIRAAHGVAFDTVLSARLLPKHRGVRAFCTPSRPIFGATRAARRHPGRKRSGRRPGRAIFRGRAAEIFQGSKSTPARRPHLYGSLLVRDLTLVSRFRSSPCIAARHGANFGITRDTSKHMVLVPVLNPKLAVDLAIVWVRTSGFGALVVVKKATQAPPHSDEQVTSAIVQLQSGGPSLTMIRRRL